MGKALVKTEQSAIARLMAGPMIKPLAPKHPAGPPNPPRAGHSLATQFQLIDETPGLSAKARANRMYYAKYREDLRNKHRSPDRRVITWQAVDQGLPDEDLLVLVTTGAGEVWPGFLEGGEWRNADSSQMGDPVTHWCDLPDPPADA